MRLRSMTRSELQAIDARAATELGLATLVLMENAGAQAATWLLARLRPEEEVLIVCGPGNNGGDGAVMARHLDGQGFRVRVAWFTENNQLGKDAATQQRILERSGIQQEVVNSQDFHTFQWHGDWVVDALLGTGLKRPVEGLLGQAIDAINASGKPVLAIDLPSGLDADLGIPLGKAVRATATVSFVASKLGFAVAGAADFIGEVHVVAIGLPKHLLLPFSV